MVDKTQISSAVDLFAELQPEFSVKGCALIRPLEFCVPVTKQNVQPPPPQASITGQPLKDDYVCYLLKCPEKSLDPARIVADQFGQRLQRKYKPAKLCVPARKAPPPCGPTTGARQCGGTCPDGSASCHFDVATKQCTCNPAQTCGGNPDAAGHCGGICPPGETCLPSLVGTKVTCDCQPPPPPPCGLNTSTGTCGGACDNPNDKCEFVQASGDCLCQPPEGGCPTTPPAGGTCGGTCTEATFLCALDPLTNQCRCQPPPQPCGPNPATGQCGGICAAPLKCRFLNTGTAGQCACEP